MKYKKYQSAEHNYISNEDLIEKLGYKVVKPRITGLGKAIMEASKHHRSISWLKNQLDVYFRKLRKEKAKHKNGN